MRIVAFDLDDTLLRDDLSISSETVSVLRELNRRGWTIVPASGRARDSMLPFVRMLSCADWFISCNGAEIWNAHTGECVSQVCFSAETGRQIALFAEENDCYAQTYDDRYFYYSTECEWATRYARSSMLRGFHVGPLSAYIHEERSKILFMDTEQKIADLLVKARERFSSVASVTCSKPYFLEFNPVNASKGKALERICRMTGVSMSDVVAFGDSLNDLSMLTFAGLGVAVGNARDDVKIQCDDVCGTNMENGVAAYLDHLFCKPEENK